MSAQPAGSARASRSSASSRAAAAGARRSGSGRRARTRCRWHRWRAGTEHCDEIAWARDGYRVGFVINGYQLRIFDAETPDSRSGQVNLIEPDGTPPTRIARGVTFSENGAAVTFDDCPRGRSGCKSGPGGGQVDVFGKFNSQDSDLRRSRT